MREAIKVIKAQGIRSARHFFSDFEFLLPLILTLDLGSSPIHAQMPFPDACRGISVFLQKGSHRQAFGFDEGRREGAENSVLSDPVGVSSGQESITGGRAARRRRMSIREKHTLPCQSIDPGSPE